MRRDHEILTLRSYILESAANVDRVRSVLLGGPSSRVSVRDRSSWNSLCAINVIDSLAYTRLVGNTLCGSGAHINHDPPPSFYVS